MTTLDRYRGCLLGLAAGDALGTTLEFEAPGSFEPLTDMVGGGPFNLKPGEWTDDTSMALCLAESLVERVLGSDAEIVARFSGREIAGTGYEPPFGFIPAEAYGERGHSFDSSNS